MLEVYDVHWKNACKAVHQRQVQLVVVFRQTDRTAAVFMVIALPLMVVVGVQENARCEVVSVMGR